MKEDNLKSLEQLAREVGKYPPDAFTFVREALQYTVNHKKKTKGKNGGHVKGQDLCWALRDLAAKRWGLLAPVVLKSWSVTSTEDFGKIVFSMVDAGWMTKTDTDSIADFQNVYDFRSAFEQIVLRD